MRIVIALGGNALLKRGEPMTAGHQRANVRVGAQALAREAQLDPGKQPSPSTIRRARLTMAFATVFVTAILVLVVSLLFVAPVIESGTPSSVPVFQAVGNACDADGGGGW